MAKASVNNELSLLKDLLVKLESDDVEFDTWKTHAIIIFESIFGKDNQKIKQIESIKNDYSSWSLRDTSGSISNLEKASEIILASIEELEVLGKHKASGAEKKDDTGNIEITKIVKQFEDELKVSQIKELKLILSSQDNADDKRSRLIGKLKEFGVDTAPSILAGILLESKISNDL